MKVNFCRKILTFGMVLMVSCSFGGCSSPSGKVAGTDEAGASPSVQSSGGKVASSLAEYARTLLQDDMSDEQRLRVERVSDSGEVTNDDYEQAWSSYKQCMTDKGYNTPVLVKYANGVYEVGQSDTSAMNEKQIEKYYADDADCRTAEVVNINALYQFQVGNPSLYSDSYVAVTDCLKREGVVDSSYTRDQFERDFLPDDNGNRRLNIDDPKVASCLAGNNIRVNRADTPTWEPLG